MTKPSGCAWAARVDAHFAGKNSVAEEAAMRRHLLENCPSCRLRYQRQAMLATLQPGGLAAEDRMAIALGISRRPGPRRLGPLFALVAACSVMAAVLLARPDGGRFQARGHRTGTGDPRAELLVLRVRPGGQSERVVDRFSASDELAFAYRNPLGKRHLFVFGVDERGHVFWFSPAWTDRLQEPPAPLVEADGDLHEIEDAVAHRYDGSRLDVYALFTDRPWRVQEIEAALAGAGSGSAPPFDGEVYLVRRFEVLP